MKIIAIDAGNTHIRLSTVTSETSESVEITHFRIEESLEQFRTVFRQEGTGVPIAIASVVQSAIEKLKQYISLAGHTGQLILCDHREHTVLTNNYSETLGIDRYVDAIAAVHRFPDRDLIIIDSGTATTIDFIRKDRTFLGGFILPGIGLKARAIGQWTDKLPLLDPYKLTIEQCPQTTEQALSSGLLIDSAGGIEKALAHGVTQLDSPLIIACGGGWEIIGPYVDFDCISMPDLTLVGTALFGFSVLTKRGM